MKNPNTTRVTLISLLSGTLLALANGAHAWTEEVESLSNENSRCRLEPESQCTQSVHIGLEAPGIDWNNSSMAQIRLDKANLQGANLSGSIMQLANLEGANLMLANFEGAHLHAANLRGSNLTMANLSGVSLLDADLRGANLIGANLRDAILIQAKLDGATWIDGRVCADDSVGECL